ncbi:uncharacterized protein si:dkey-171c9.3 [Pimephales promelas]|uniref:uncharacterized protein si:dkey-171c9.3 n=1 Tax=Pimephales promelas TaxID=90988 RepID=UPI0019557ADD|nr:uncharacterized protein si:dkey-171c9.3 [Pimephales promelas]KAG1936264.1 A-kinase anchor protein [Pimephales promelas]KAG1936265.1 A-kinase anchor protein [Pimephales promelas]KAG1936266.1 A-kinase anchor protein [Pimephales promelas]
MINEEWLCSSFKLCDLVTASQSGHSNDSTQIVINSDSYPRPAYNPSSIQHTMETYSRLLDGTLEQNIEPIQTFAHMTAKAILDSSMGIRGPSESVKVRQDEVEMLAEELTVKVCCKALEEMERQHHSDDASKNINDNGVKEGTNENASVLCSSGYKCDKNAFEIETDKMEDYDDTLTTVYANSLKSMCSLGSLDYPDAPPSTPLLPEMMRSRASFTRKLKGGLAKEFLPSPPPPTPKDHMQPLLENQMTDTSADFMVRLMRSLSLECCRNGGREEVKDDGGLQNDYAAQISADIIHSLTTNELKVKDEGCVNRIFDRLASEIVTTSLAEVMARGERKVLKEETPSYPMPSDKRSSMQFSATDEVKILANELIIEALVHAFAKLRQGVFEHGTEPHLSGQAAEPQPWEEERCANTLCKDSINSLKAKICCNDKSELNPISLDANVTSSVHRFSNDFAEDVIQHSVCDASRFLFNCKQSEGAEFGSQKDIKPQVIKIHAEESRLVQELQCALLWAAASQNGTSALQFDLPDTSLQQQLCRLSHSARLNGWTVGALMASLEEFCDMQRATSRGRYKSSDSLLEHLQHLIDNSHLN